MSDARFKVTVPGRVWLSFLDPRASEAQVSFGLSEPQRVVRGAGEQIVYDGLDAAQVEDLAEYLCTRAETLLGQAPSKGEADTLRAGVKAAKKMRALIAA